MLVRYYEAFVILFQSLWPSCVMKFICHKSSKQDTNTTRCVHEALIVGRSKRESSKCTKRYVCFCMHFHAINLIHAVDCAVIDRLIVDCY